MKLILYKTADSPSVIGKVLTEPLELTIRAPKNFDIYAPTLYLAPVDGVDIEAFNYFELPDLGRFYIVEEVEAVNARLFLFRSVCDYLETYKAEILASEGNYRRKVKAGDFGELSLTETGRETYENHASNTTLTPDNKAILSVMGGYYG